MEGSRDFIAYSLTVDESMDVRDTAQLAIFILGVDSNCFETNLLDLQQMEHQQCAVKKVNLW